MTHATQGREFCIRCSVCRRILIETLSITVADKEHNTEHFIVV